MSKLELKTAMDLLQVNKPLRLAGRAPSFVPPAPTPPSQITVENPTQVEKVTEVGLQTQVQKMTEVEILAVVTNPTQVAKQTEVDFDTQVENQTTVPKETPVSKTTQVVRHIEIKPDQLTELRRATEQDSSVVLEARACEGLAKGYTRLPNSVLMVMANGDLTRGEIKILLLIARFTISFQRKLAPLSKTVLERQSGLRGAGVLEALAGLVSKKLIIKEQGDQHRPNMLGLVLPLDWDQLIAKSETSVVKSTPVQKSTPVEFLTSVIKVATGEVTETTPAPVENPSPFKLYSNKNSHSPLSENLRKYFNEVKPRRKRETELQAFQDLKADFPEGDISLAFEYLLKHGMPGSNENCHSPMSYLAKAIGQILETAKSSQEKHRSKIDREAAEIRVKETQEGEEAREIQNAQLREHEFQKAFPSEREQVDAILQFGRKFPMLSQSGPLLRNLAISAWWDEIQTR